MASFARPAPALVWTSMNWIAAMHERQCAETLAHVRALYAAEVRRRVLPAARAGEVDELARGQRSREALLGLAVEKLPAGVRDRGE